MEWMFLGIVVFLFVLAAFDLFVGVSNDAVNFLNSAIGSRAAKFRTLVTIASVGVFFGCALSNGMMDIARHGIFTPQYFSFREVMFIYLSVMVTDVVMLDIFNSYGMPTSTTVSMVFELLGASFAFVVIKSAAAEGALGMAEYLNTSKALEVIMGIFLSVPIAFCFGAIVQWIARIVFTFNIRSKLRWKIGIYGGIAITAIIYFMLFKGLKDLSFMSADVKAFIKENILLLLGAIFVVSTIVMQLLHVCKVNVFRAVVLCGTFALATAFAGNDLVNFIGVPLAGYASFQDFTTNAGTLAPDGFMMHSLGEKATTPLYFLIIAGAIMVVSLATSKKARRVVKTEVGLANKNEGDEMFGSSKAARSLVRWSRSVGEFCQSVTPASVRRWINSRFTTPENYDDEGKAFDLCRASVNLCMASLLIALGTSLKLPLSTTFVTFMVAMGTSLADRAWSRESAVFRITGVLTVIGGWFITAGAAFVACFCVALVMHFGGFIVAILLVALALFSIIRSQIRFAKAQKEVVNEGDVLFRQMIETQDHQQIIPMLSRHIAVSVAEQLEKYGDSLSDATDGLFNESLRPMRQSLRELNKGKRELKNLRRRETICLRRAEPRVTGIRLSTNFHLIHNALRQMLYGLLRIAEPAREHVDNNFTPVNLADAERYCKLRNRVVSLLRDVAFNLRNQLPEKMPVLEASCTALQSDMQSLMRDLEVDMQRTESNLTPTTLLLHMVEETCQLVVEIRDLIKAEAAYRAQI